jgi:hypothetical protein
LRFTRGPLAVAVLVIGLVAACQPAGPSPAASGGPTSSASAAVPSAGSEPPTSAVDVDLSLLSILPAEVGGAEMRPAEDVATDLALDPTLATHVEAIAVALAVAPGASGGEDLVIANVVRLRPDVFDDAFFREWRDSYDEAACEVAGGKLGNAETEIDGRKVFIGSCVNDAFTYHLRYGEDVIVSLTSLGESRLGELVVNELAQ